MKALCWEVGPIVLVLTLFYRAHSSSNIGIAATGLFVLLISVLTLSKESSRIKQETRNFVSATKSAKYSSKVISLLYNLFCLFVSALLTGFSFGEITAASLAAMLPVVPVEPTIAVMLLVLLAVNIIDGLKSGKKLTSVT